MTRRASSLIATTLFAATAAAIGAMQIDADAGATLPDGPDTGTIALRIMAEIDGDPATFTTDERRRLAVLAQVLGTSPLSLEEQFALLDS